MNKNHDHRSAAATPRRHGEGAAPSAMTAACSLVASWRLGGRCCLLAAFAVLALEAADQPRQPVNLIFDTDIGNDVDDVLALGVIHALQTRGECKLLAVTITKDHPLAAAFTDAVNTFYGRGEIPIGVCRSGVTNDQGKFLGLATKQDDGKPRYPHDLTSGKDAPDAVTVLRRVLAGAADHSVVIAQVGFSTNLANLLESKGDSISPLSGPELVKAKVPFISIMAGEFTGKNHREYNVEKDIPSAKKLAADWPTPIVWSGFEIGLAVATPAVSIQRDYAYVKHHPLAESYILYEPPPHNRPTWDLTSVLYAVRPDRGYFDVSPTGRVTVADTSITTFTPGEGRDRILKFRDGDGQKARTQEALMLLASEPPKHHGTAK
jgi:inosine-uridine nucleoside N-ribohydrolase